MEYPERYFFPAVFTFGGEGEIAVDFPDLRCATSGTDEIDAFTSARELLGCVLFGMEEDGDEIPRPSSVGAVERGDDELVMLVDVFMPPVRRALAQQAAVPF